METLTSYDYELPHQLIAKYPLKQRSASRLMVIEQNNIIHRKFRDLLDYLQSSDALVLNNTKVFKARLNAVKEESGGKVEILLCQQLNKHKWTALLNAGRKIKPQTKLALNNNAQATVISNTEDEGAYILEFDCDIFEHCKKFGELPLPPYMERTSLALDDDRYQTIYASQKHQGAVAAPTAGLHFDDEMLEQVLAKGVKIIYVTLNVGPGTFLPVRKEDISKHRMHSEQYEVSQDAANLLNETRAIGQQIIAVGTTVIRTLEANLQSSRDNLYHAQKSDTRLFITPGYSFKAVDALVTNFHLPKSTLLMLTSALVGKKRLLRAYEEAIKQEYRFFSYGDACFMKVSKND